MIEAVRDVSEDANDQKNSAIGQLMDLIVRSALAQNNKIIEYKDEVNRTYAELTSPDRFPQLGSLQENLTKSLKTYYQDVGVKLEWGETPGVTMPPPQAAIKFREDKFEYPVSKAGNGVQRAFIIALLHQLLIAKSNSGNEKDNKQPANDDFAQHMPDDDLLEKLPSVILAIEEPELYQHPTKQWHFAQVLRRLSSGEMKNTFGDVQVLFCTHSPVFIGISDFENARITRKILSDEEKAKKTVFQNACMKDMVEFTKNIQEDDKEITIESIRASLHIFGTELSEGFFSDGVVLVEGITDKVALETVASKMNRSFSEYNISVLPVGGKNNMARPWIVFNQLEIPVFPLWDADLNFKDGKREDHVKTNRFLQRMVGIEEKLLQEFPDGTYNKFACFGRELGNEMRDDFGVDDYDKALVKSKEHFNMYGDKGKKNPHVIKMTIEEIIQFWNEIGSA